MTVIAGMSRRAWYLVAAAAVLIVGPAVLLTMDAVQAKGALTRAAAHAERLRSQIEQGDSAAATRTLTALQAATASARAHSDGPGWAMASWLPLLGDDVEAVRTVASSADTIAVRAMPAAVRLAGRVDAKAFSPHDGRIDIAGLSDIAPELAATSTVLDAEGTKVAAIDPDHLIGALAPRVRQAQEKIAAARSAARAGALATAMAPSVLGAKAPRSYLLIFQNNAEIRATGGLTGAFVIMHVDNGRLGIDEPGSNRDVIGIAKPVLPLTADEKAMYPTTLGTDIRSTNFTPHFPRTAALARAIVQQKLGRQVDGVISVDPVALSYLLRGTGPVTLPDGDTLTPQNTVRKLLNEVYRKIPEPMRQDAYFAAATKSVFDRVISGDGDPKEVIRALAQGVAERRVMFWSADRTDQAKLAGTAVADELPGRSDRPEVGLYLTDASQAKLQYYLDFATTVTATDCSADGVQTLVATTRLTSHVPRNADALPPYIVGSKMKPGWQKVIARFYAPAGGAFSAVEVNGREATLYGLRENGRPVTYVVQTLKPGQTATIKATMVSGRRAWSDARFLTTPGLDAVTNRTLVRSGCG